MQIFTRYFKYRKMLGILAILLSFLFISPVYSQVVGNTVSVPPNTLFCIKQSDVKEIISVHTAEGFAKAAELVDAKLDAHVCGITEDTIPATITDIFYEGELSAPNGSPVLLKIYEMNKQVYVFRFITLPGKGA